MNNSPPNIHGRLRATLVVIGFGLAILTPALGATDNVITATHTAQTAIDDTVDVTAPAAIEATTSIDMAALAFALLALVVIAAMVVSPVARRRGLTHITSRKNRAIAGTGGGELLFDGHIDTGPCLGSNRTALDNAMYDGFHDTGQMNDAWVTDDAIYQWLDDAVHNHGPDDNPLAAGSEERPLVLTT